MAIDLSAPGPTMDAQGQSPAAAGADGHSVGATLDLRDIHVPGDPGFWPPAPGWWLLALLLLAALAAAMLGGLARWRRARRRRRILSELERLGAEEPSAPALAAGVSALLKRVALSRFNRAEVAALTGEAWLAFLDRTGGNGRFHQGPGRVLADGPYVPSTADLDAEDLLNVARDWLRRNL